MATPRIAVTRWENVPGERQEAYWQRLRDQGLEPIDYVEPGRPLEGCAGLLLTGGTDVDPALYAEPAAPQTQAPNPGRDAFESALLRQALDADLPVLAVCRGHQLLNVCLGGSLLQHIESGAHVAVAVRDPSSSVHDVVLAAGSRLAGWLGSERIAVNSRHHQAVTPARLAAGLVATGWTDDGLVEAVESAAHRWAVGVQWHPERTEPQIEGFEALSQRLFAAFAAAVRVA